MASSFVVELWVEYAVGITAFFLRFFARWKTVGFQKLALDDLFCVLGLVFYTLDAGLTYTYGTKGSSVGLTPETALELDEATVREFTIGSKCLFVAWICYITLTWILKGVLLSLYSRITIGLWQHKYVKYVIVFCIIAWSACIIFHFAVCTPIQRSWQVVPYPGDNCVLRKPNHALVGVLNILSDVCIIAIALPVLFAARMPIFRKLVLGLLFCSGLFVIVTVILRVVFSLGDIGSLPTAGSWALRETFVSVITVTAPGIKPLFNRSHWISSSTHDTDTDPKPGGSRSMFHSQKSDLTGNITTVSGNYPDGLEQGGGRQNYELSSVNWTRKVARKHGMQPLSSDSASEEHIVSNKDDENAIHVVTEYRLDREGSDESHLE